MHESPVSVAEILERSAGASADTALAWGPHRRTYGELRDRSRALAGALQRAGLSPGDRVAAYVFNRGESFELYFACALAGLTFAPVNFRLTTRELALVLQDSGARIMFTQESLAETARAAAADLQLVVLGDDEPGPTYDAMAEGDPSAVPSTTPETHLLLFTSGTTGRPKAVRLTHTNILWFVWQQVTYYSFDRSSVSLVVAPTFNMAGISMFGLPTLLVGGTVVIQPTGGWAPEVLVGLVDRWQVTHTSVFPSQFKALLAAADGVEAMGLESLRLVATGGESSSPELLRRFRQRWPHIRLLQGYGQTETGTVTVCVGDDLEQHPRSIGRPIVGTTCRILRKDGSEASRDETGELFVRGPSVSSDYWNAPDLNRTTFANGWFATGDLGHQDELGLFYLSGRIKEVIISKAQNVYPAEVEHVLMGHQQIADVAVVGIPDEEWGEAVTAGVVRAAGSELSEAEVVAYARDALASYKKPRHVVFVDELPRNGSGKVDRASLAKRISQTVGR